MMERWNNGNGAATPSREESPTNSPGSAGGLALPTTPGDSEVGRGLRPSRSSSSPSPRIPWLDALRTLACIAVVTLHVTMPVFIDASSSIGSIWWTTVILATLVSWAVPVFILISGALLLQHPHHEAPASFFSHRVRLFVQTAFWTLFYIAFRFTSEPWVTVRQLGTDLWHGVPYYHLWFLYMIAGLYLVTPILCRVVRSVAAPLRGCLAVLLWMVFCVVLWKPQPFFQTLPTLFIPYTAYYLIGYELRNRPPATGKTGRWAVLFAAAGVGLVLIYWLTDRGMIRAFPLSWLFGAFSPLVALLAISLFQGFQSRHDPTPSGECPRWISVLARLSPLTLGIYVLHPIFLVVLTRLGFPGAALDPSIALVLMATLVFAWSTVTAWALSRIPGVRNVVAGR